MAKFIAIDGDGGSGKTFLSSILANKLSAPVYHLDDYGDDYHPFIGIPKLINDVKYLHEDLIIVEGIGVFDERFDFLNPVRIFVNTPTSLRTDRALSRDKPTSERSAKEWQKIYKIWEEQTSEYISHAKLRADIIVEDSGSKEADFIISKLGTVY